jgi:hypothetical protein
MSTTYEDLLAQEAAVTLTQTEFYEYWDHLHFLMHKVPQDLSRIEHPSLTQREAALANLLQKRNG